MKNSLARLVCSSGLCRDYAELGCGFAVSEDELDRGVRRETDSHGSSLLASFKDAILLAVDAQQPVRLRVANFLGVGLHSGDLLCVDYPAG